MNKELTATEFARNQAEYLNRVAYKGESFIITRGKKPIAELRPTQPILRGKDIREVWARIPHLDPEEAEAFAKDVEEAQRWGNQTPVDRWAE